MSNRGWIKLHRKIQDHWIYQEKRTFSRYEAWLDLIMLANHRDNRSLIDGELVAVKKGSFITSKRQLCTRWDWSNTKVDRFLDLLEQDEMITHKSDTKKTVITIVKYEVYHELEKEKRHENDSEELEIKNERQFNGIVASQKNDTETSAESVDVTDLEDITRAEKRHRNETETKRKHNRNETETDKQELKNLRTKELKDPTTTVPENDAIVFYQNNFGMIRPIIAEEILDWINDLGDEMVIEAMKRSLERNKPNWGYTKSILRSWHEKGIKTIEQAKAEDIEFRNQQQRRFGNRQQPEVIPEWFNKRKQQNKQAHRQEIDPATAEKERQELADMIRQFS